MTVHQKNNETQFLTCFTTKNLESVLCGTTIGCNDSNKPFR